VFSVHRDTGYGILDTWFARQVDLYFNCFKCQVECDNILVWVELSIYCVLFYEFCHMQCDSQARQIDRPPQTIETIEFIQMDASHDVRI